MQPFVVVAQAANAERRRGYPSSEHPGRLSRRYQSIFTPKRTMRGGMMVEGKPNEPPET
jgi:hypothetical protein